MTWNLGALTLTHPEQVVLEADPPHRLSYTWHSLTPEWAARSRLDPEVQATVVDQPRSVATFELEPDGSLVKLTVTHSNLLPDGRLIQLISNGWPRVLSDLKSFAETGTV